MKAVVLVGGFGTRLRPLTLDTPKQMLPVVDRPMIEWVLGHLAKHGVDEAVLSLGYRPEPFLERYADQVCAGVRLHYAVEDEPLDTAGAVGFAARHAEIDERFLVINGDVMTDLDITALVAVHEAADAEGTLHLTPVDDPSRYGVVPIDDEGRVMAFVEKPPRDEAPTNWINAGTYVLEPSVLDRIPVGAKASIERETFPAMAAEGRLYAWQSDVYWIDTGTPATYVQAQVDLTDGSRADRVPAIAAAADVDPTATVEQAIIMDGARIDAGAVVRRGAVLPGAHVAEGAVIEEAILGPDAVLGAAARLDGWSIVGRGEAVAAGAHLHEARIPGAAV